MGHDKVYGVCKNKCFVELGRTPTIGTLSLPSYTYDGDDGHLFEITSAAKMQMVIKYEDDDGYFFIKNSTGVNRSFLIKSAMFDYIESKSNFTIKNQIVNINNNEIEEVFNGTECYKGQYVEIIPLDILVNL